MNPYNQTNPKQLSPLPFTGTGTSDKLHCLWSYVSISLLWNICFFRPSQVLSICNSKYVCVICFVGVWKFGISMASLESSGGTCFRNMYLNKEGMHFWSWTIVLEYFQILDLCQLIISFPTGLAFYSMLNDISIIVKLGLRTWEWREFLSNEFQQKTWFKLCLPYNGFKSWNLATAACNVLLKHKKQYIVGWTTLKTCIKS